ncbi:hypothetical protein [Almyronema epifaneia]|uniref:Uncharacterized protein n=1 Tax=Almyronema epifaneia S1 TaxID=2991925 RepID=A0ABW6IJJ6_9CYAN
MCLKKENQKAKNNDQEDVAEQQWPVELEPAENDQNEAATRQKSTSKTLDERDEILQRAKKLGVRLEDRKLAKAIAAHPSRLETAVTALVEKTETVRYPTRFLERAILEAWEPERKQNLKFSQWFDEAKQHGCEVLGGQMIDDVQWVYASDGQPYRWHELNGLPWDELRAKLNPVPIDLPTPPRSKVIFSQPELAQEVFEVDLYDLSPLLVALDVEIARLGWSEALLSDHLYQWFLKRERSLLTDDQLHELLELLQEMVIPAEVA